MTFRLKTMLAAGAMTIAAHAAAQVSFYEGEGFRGQVFRVAGPVGNFDRTGFNDRASSIIIERGRWEVCDDARFAGRCVVLGPGSYPSLQPFGMSNRISSVRPVNRPATYVAAAPPAAPVYDYRRRPSERVFEADVTSVRAVVGPPEQRCWVERQQFESRNEANVPGAIVGGLLGGVLGHQVGGGRGRDVATVGGAVAGAAIGANVGRGGGGAYGQDVQRCASAPSSGRAEYWDVTYNFRGVEHRTQLGSPPGRTIPVNGRGEPRI